MAWAIIFIINNSLPMWAVFVNVNKLFMYVRVLLGSLLSRQQSDVAALHLLKAILPFTLIFFP